MAKKRKYRRSGFSGTETEHKSVYDSALRRARQTLREARKAGDSAAACGAAADAMTDAAEAFLENRWANGWPRVRGRTPTGDKAAALYDEARAFMREACGCKYRP